MGATHHNDMLISSNFCLEKRRRGYIRKTNYVPSTCNGNLSNLNITEILRKIRTNKNEIRIDLQGTDMSGANLRGVNFSKANLSNAD